MAGHDTVELEKGLRELGPVALARLREVLEGSADEQALLRAIENILDRAGLGRQAKQEVRAVITIDQETIERLEHAEAVLRAAEGKFGAPLLLPPLPPAEDKGR